MLGALMGPLCMVILASTYPLFTPSLSSALLKEEIKPIVLMGTALIVAGASSSHECWISHHGKKDFWTASIAYVDC